VRSVIGDRKLNILLLNVRLHMLFIMKQETQFVQLPYQRVQRCCSANTGSCVTLSYVCRYTVAVGVICTTVDRPTIRHPKIATFRQLQPLTTQHHCSIVTPNRRSPCKQASWQAGHPNCHLGIPKRSTGMRRHSLPSSRQINVQISPFS
jgi:hypothetical protein